jgi:acyl carrier protein
MTTISPGDVIPRLKRRLPKLAPLFEEDTPLHALGLDSMDTVELLCAIHEEFNVRLSEREFQPAQRLGDLAKTIANKQSSQ